MPTCARALYDESVCHIIQRGNNRQQIFRDEEDYGKFLSLIEDYLDRYAFELYNYCLMPNHVHLLLKIFRKDDLSKVMQGIFQSFRFYFRKKYKYTGYLYQGRYKSKLIELDNYLLECARYIERNPLRAEIVKDLSAYKWTSYQFYANGRGNGIITENPMFYTLGSEKARQREAYRQYVIPPRPYEDILDKALGIG